MIPERRRAAVLVVGDELVEGRQVDTNSGEIARALARIGVEVELVLVLGDDEHRVAQMLSELCAEYALVVGCGGLGPTLDDVTRHAAARAAGVPLELSEPALERLRGRYRAQGAAMPEANARQALFPAGAQIVPNPLGSAEGFRLWIRGGLFAALPGPPREMRRMLTEELLPWFERTCGRGGAIASRELFLAGVSESGFADQVGAWMERGAEPGMSVTSHHGTLTVRVRAEATSPEAAERLVAERLEQVRERFREHVYDEAESRFAHVLGRHLIESGLTVATAESCTGGLVAAQLTEVPGISAVFREGFVTYSNEAKERTLGVPREVIERCGAVSAEVAAAMASGARAVAGADLAVSLTGVAGPGGGTAEKPVGLVWFGLAREGEVATLERRMHDVGREGIRRYAAHAALELLWRAATGRHPTGS